MSVPVKPKLRQIDAVMFGPEIVCLCGSTRFKAEFIRRQFIETMRGRIVLSVGWFGHADGDVYTPTDQEKTALDELHKRKIDLAHRVIVIAPNGYTGDSTRSEIGYAHATGKPVLYDNGYEEDLYEVPK